MIQLLLLSIATGIIFTLTFLIWRKTRSIAFLIGIFYLIYWGLIGLWIFYFDANSGFEGKQWGMTYYHYFDKLVEVKLDAHFSNAIILHSLFIIAIQLSILFSYKRTSSKTFKILLINPIYLIGLSCVFWILAIFFITEDIAYTYANNEVLYHIVELSDNKYFTLHQVSLQLALTSLFIYFSLLLSKNARKIKLASYTFKNYFFAAILLAIMIPALNILGNKKELLFSGLIAVLLFIGNNKFTSSTLLKFIVLCGILILPLITTDIVRGAKFRSLTNLKLEYKPSTGQISSRSNSDYIGGFLFSNELFVPNFSMYAVLSNEVEPAYGISFKYLGSSLIPRFIKKERPPDVYDYYVNEIHADVSAGQGYTIHHATAWLLNLGKGGIIIGGLLLGFLWGKLSSVKLGSANSSIVRILEIFIPIITCAYLPVIIRSGIEVYKAYLVEGVFLTCIIIFISLNNSILKGRKVE